MLKEHDITPLYQEIDITDTPKYWEALKSALHVGLLSIGDRTGGYAVRHHINQLKALGADEIRITVKGIPLSEPEVFEFEFKIPPENVMGRY
jgi:hypothetical protein